MNWYHTWYDNYGYTRGQKPHAKALACYTGHVAVVEQVDGDEITISEGGWGPAGKEHGYTIIQTMTQKELESDRGGTGAFIGYVYLDGAQLGGEDNPSNPGDGNSENSDQIIIKIIIRAITPEMKMPEKAAILQMDGITTVWHGNIFRMDVL